MPRPQSAAATLIADLQVRFHDRHRVDLPLLVDLARAYAWRGGSAGLADQFMALTEALEAHMFKEETRLFPMMEQGGNSLIGQLIEDMRAERVSQKANVVRIQTLLSAERAEPAAEAQLSALRAAARKFFEDLAEHMRIEDEQLFPQFARRAS